MKNNILQITMSSIRAVILLGCCGFMTVGCNSGGSSSSPAATTSTVPPGLTGSTSTTSANGYAYSSGATAVFVPDSMAVMNTYVAVHPLNAPTGFEINVLLNNNGGSAGYGGVVQISYYDNGQTYNSYLQTGSGTVYNPGGDYDGQSVTEFNQWFNFQGKSVFHGFFQDQYGAIMLVVDQLQSNGDGGVASTVSGSVYFKNFGAQNCDFPPPGGETCGQGNEQCWFIEEGPYDCEAFVVNGRVDTTVGLYPGSGYTRLGTFSGLSYSAAFGN